MRAARALAAIIVASTTLTVSPASALTAADPGGVIEVTTDFVGVRPTGPNATSAQADNTITWIGDPSNGSTTVLWTRHRPQDLRDSSGRRIEPQFVGRLTPSQIRQVEQRLRPEASASAAWGGGILLCSLNIAKPYWNQTPAQARGGVSQVCSNFNTQKVSEWLSKFVGAVPSLQDTDVFGPATIPFVSALGLKGCLGSTARTWLNTGHGEATLNGVHYSGPTETASRTLGCG